MINFKEKRKENYEAKGDASLSLFFSSSGDLTFYGIGLLLLLRIGLLAGLAGLLGLLLPSF